MQSLRLIAFIAVFGFIFAVPAVLLGIYKKRQKILKYIPAILAAVLTFAFVIKAYMFSEGFEGLGYIVMSMISAAVFAVSLITAIVIEIIQRRH